MTPGRQGSRPRPLSQLVIHGPPLVLNRVIIDVQDAAFSLLNIHIRGVEAATVPELDAKRRDIKHQVDHVPVVVIQCRALRRRSPLVRSSVPADRGTNDQTSQEMRPTTSDAIADCWLLATAPPCSALWPLVLADRLEMC